MFTSVKTRRVSLVADGRAASLCSRCVICMMDFEYSDPIRFLPCLHIYHVDCIDPWLMRSFTCPSCMEPVDAALLSSYETNWAAPSRRLPPESNGTSTARINPRGSQIGEVKWLYGGVSKVSEDAAGRWRLWECVRSAFWKLFAFFSSTVCQINLDENVAKYHCKWSLLL